MKTADPTRRWTTAILVGTSLVGSLLSLPAQSSAAPSATIVKENPPPSVPSSQSRQPSAPRPAEIVPQNVEPPHSASKANPALEIRRALPAGPRTVPAADSGAPKDRQMGEIVVNITKDGTLKVNSQILTEDQLGGRLKEIHARNPKQAIILRAEEETVYKNMFRVLDLCYQAGLYHVSFASRSPTPPVAP